MNLEPKAKQFLVNLLAANLPPLEAGTPEQARAIMRQIRKTAPPTALHRVENFSIGGVDREIKVRLYAAQSTVRACLLYLHGGGWVLGSVDDSDAFARELAASTGCAVISVNYRLAPEAPFPAALEDASESLRWLASYRHEFFGGAIPIGIIGDSSGANLATVLAGSDAGRAMIAFQILAYPVTDARMNTVSYQEFAHGTHLTAAAMAWFWGHYVPNPWQRSDPRVSPLLAESLAGAPPAFVLTAENDPLRDEGEAYAARLTRDGVPTVCKRYAGQLHGFLTLVGVFDGGAAALVDIAHYVEERLAR